MNFSQEQAVENYATIASGVSYLNGQFSITSGTGKGLILDQFGKQLGLFTTNTTEMNKPSIAWDNHCLSM